MMLSGEVLAPEASPMDLTAAFSGLQQSKVLGEVQIAVARKLLDQQRLDGSAAVQLIEAASKGVNPVRRPARRRRNRAGRLC